MKARVSSSVQFSASMMASSSASRRAATKARHSSSISPLAETQSTKVLDEVLLVAQARAGVDGARISCADLLVVAVAALRRGTSDEHEDVVDVDLDLLDQLDLEDDVVVDRLLLGVLVLAELGVEVEVDAAVVLALPLGEDLVAGELVERGQDVLQPQDRAEEGDELLLRRLADDRLPEREPLEQLGRPSRRTRRSSRRTA